MQILLKKPADMHALEGYYDDALCIVSDDGHEKVVQLIRKYRARLQV